MINLIKDLIRYTHILYLSFRVGFKKSISIKDTALFIAPHPDDEALGCGGLISHLCLKHNYPHVIIMTGGGGSIKFEDGDEALGVEANKKKCPTSEDIIRERRKLTLRSAKELGIPVENIHFLDFLDGHIADRPEQEMTRLRELIAKINPDSIFIPHWGEGWPDHTEIKGILNNVQPQSLRPIIESSHPQIYYYCVWMWYYNIWKLDWENAFKFKMNKTEYQAKLKAVESYIKPMAPNGLPWSGVLPKPFVFANTRRTELYFKVINN